MSQDVGDPGKHRGETVLLERFLSYWRGHTGSQPGLETRGIGVFRCLGTRRRDRSGDGKSRT